ncbi:MAG: ABC transporter permease [Gemmatirosa sp.]|nr:ABC transporter permease [Gemmatirosa sp.]
MLDLLLADVRHGARSLRGSPMFVLLASLTLALGIGASTAIFSVVNAVLLRPLDYDDSARLAVVRGDGAQSVTPATFLAWKQSSRTMRLGAAESWSPTLTGGERAEALAGIHVTSDMLALLGVRPAIGRLFTAEEEHAGHAGVAVLRYELWQRRFGADRSIVGRTIVLDGAPYTVVGVMPRGFRFTPFWAAGADIGAPLVLDDRVTDDAINSLRTFARIAPGATFPAARAEMATIGARLRAEKPDGIRAIDVLPLQDVVVGQTRPALLVLLASVGLVMLIVCANVAHLQLVRSAARERDYAVRAALGATRRRMVRQSLIESAMLSLAGGAVGLTLGWSGVRLIVALGPSSLPRLDTVGVDGRVVAFTLVVTIVAATLAGLVPALAASRVRVHDSLKEGGRGGGDGAVKVRVRGILVVSEFALAVVLLVSAGLVLRSLSAMLNVDAGFDPRRTVSMIVSVRGTADSAPDRRALFFDQLLERVRTLPRVEAAGLTNHLPLHGDTWRFHFAIEGRPRPRPQEEPSAVFRVVRPGYFQAMHVPLLGGRDVSGADLAQRAPVVVVSERMARRHWPGESALGRRISIDDGHDAPWYTIVGVVQDVQQGDWSEPHTEEMYFPALPPGNGAPSLLNPASMTLVVRTTADAAAMASAVERVVRALDRDVPVSDVITLEQALAEHVTQPRFYVVLLGGFAAIAVVLAAVGVYGVIGYSVTRRTREIGIRLALGASRGAPFRLVVGQGMRLAVGGGAIGLLAAFAATRYLRSLLFGVQPTDPITFALVALLLGAVALAACCVPAWRASRVSPMTALRAQ